MEVVYFAWVRERIGVPEEERELPDLDERRALGVTRQHEDVVSFAARQVLDMASPSNFVATNPELLQRTLRQGGMNLVRGAQNLVEDWDRAMGGRRPVGCDAFAVGRDVAR